MEELACSSWPCVQRQTNLDGSHEDVSDEDEATMESENSGGKFTEKREIAIEVSMRNCANNDEWVKKLRKAIVGIEEGHIIVSSRPMDIEGVAAKLLADDSGKRDVNNLGVSGENLVFVERQESKVDSLQDSGYSNMEIPISLVGNIGKSKKKQKNKKKQRCILPSANRNKKEEEGEQVQKESVRHNEMEEMTQHVSSIQWY
ncbi:hypothetical protein RIF29_39237 [Crotalaria pallida]|uniref:Uncharacterized protein n=1 Tax=Crotalaria pallida TaxID=3830 RepID=A0AAN9E1P9_CROPI